MDESFDEPEVRKPSRRKQLGAVLFWIGFIIVAISFIPIIASALGTSVTNYRYVVDFMIVGVIIAIFGLFTALFPEGYTEEGTWIMKMSPFAGNN